MAPSRSRWVKFALPGLAVALGLLAFLPWASWLGFAGSIELAVYRTTLREWSLWTLAIVAGEHTQVDLEL